MPAHALSELTNEKQFSLSYLVHRLGAGDRTSRCGSGRSRISQASRSVAPSQGRSQRASAAPAWSPRCRRLSPWSAAPSPTSRRSRRQFPVRCSWRRAFPALRRALVPVLVLLAIPWVQFTTLGTAFGLLAALAAAVLTHSLGGARALASGLVALAAILYIALLTALVRTPVPSPDALLAAAYDPRALAETSWQLYVETVAHSQPARIRSGAGLRRSPDCWRCLFRARTRRAARPVRAPAQTFAPDGNGSNVNGRKAFPSPASFAPARAHRRSVHRDPRAKRARPHEHRTRRLRHRPRSAGRLRGFLPAAARALRARQQELARKRKRVLAEAQAGRLPQYLLLPQQRPKTGISNCRRG